MHEIFAKYWLRELALGYVLPEHNFIVDLLNEEPVLSLLKDHKLLVEVF